MRQKKITGQRERTPQPLIAQLMALRRTIYSS